MITDEYLPQPFRFLNQIVRQVVEDSIEQAVVRELSLTKIKRLRIPRDIVNMPLHIDQSLTSLLSLSNTNTDNKNEEGDLLVDGSEDGENDLNNNEGEEEPTNASTAANNKNTNTTNEKFLSTVKQQFDPLYGLDFFASPVVTATGSASAAIVINRQTGQFTAIDQSFPNEDEDENLSHQNNNNTHNVTFYDQQQQQQRRNNTNANGSSDDDEGEQQEENNNNNNEGGEDEQQQKKNQQQRRNNNNNKNSPSSTTIIPCQHPTRTGTLPGTVGELSQVFVDNGGAIDREKILQNLVNGGTKTTSTNPQSNNTNNNTQQHTSTINPHAVFQNPYNNVIGGLLLYQSVKVVPLLLLLVLLDQK